MNGAERLVETALRAGVRFCFANPGTTELPLVRALDALPGIRAVLCLHENVCSAAADGYGRLAGVPALALLHLGPGLANALANLHNARRARSPVVAVVGDHASWHLSADAPLTMDIEPVAGAVSKFLRRVSSPDRIAHDTAEAIAAAREHPGGVATLIVPFDHQLAPAAAADPVQLAALRPRAPATFDVAAVERAARLLTSCRPACLFLGGRSLFGRGLQAAGRIAAVCGATLVGEVGFARLEIGRGLPRVVRLPYFPEQAQSFLDRFAAVVLCGAPAPVSFFGYPDQPSRYLSGRRDVVALAGPEDDVESALEALADTLSAPAAAAPAEAEPLPPAVGPLDVEKLGIAVARALPEGCVLVLTAVSSAHPFHRFAASAAPHSELALTGGAIGEGGGLAIGAALARPGTRVIHVEADGSAAYLPQAFWTQAREGLAVTTVICANRAYRILQIELARAGLQRPGGQTAALTDLGSPPIDWIAVARGFGVQGERVHTAEELASALTRGLAIDGPYVIEALLP
ncbi:Putative acetolactate synthase large subunit IlvX [bacterium HR40]|nr:Putative acetolactate synthase large subunit IlvX [bacterium HR40]